MSDTKAQNAEQGQTALEEIHEDTANQNQQLQAVNQQNREVQNQPHYRTYENGRSYPIRESRIKDRPNYSSAREGSINIKIELDLEVEVDLYARVKGDVTIGLM